MRVMPWLALCLGAVALPAAAALPAAGRYDGQLCVATGDAPAGCGAAIVDVRPGGRLRVQVSDIVYRLELHSSQVDVVLTQGSMQLDEFTAHCDWNSADRQGATLRFVDTDKNARYEVRVGAPKAVTTPPPRKPIETPR